MAKDPNKVSVVNTYTGEVMDYSTASDADTAVSYAAINANIKALERAKDKIKERVIKRLGKDDVLRIGNFTWKRVTVQYSTYDLTTMRQVLDEDLFAQLVVPNKTMIDGMIAEGVMTPDQCSIPPEIGSQLRRSMVEARKPVTQLRLDKDTK